jgi:hypothetical protein
VATAKDTMKKLERLLLFVIAASLVAGWAAGLLMHNDSTADVLKEVMPEAGRFDSGRNGVYTGYNDIVYYFMCKSINMLGSDGICALITSNYYLGNEYAKLLRKFLAPHLVKVVNFKDYKVKA